MVVPQTCHSYPSQEHQHGNRGSEVDSLQSGEPVFSRFFSDRLRRLVAGVRFRLFAWSQELTGKAHDQQCGERLCDQTCCSEPRMPRLDSEQAARSSLYSGKLQFDGLCIQVPMLNTEIWCTIADVIERIDSAC